MKKSHVVDTIGAVAGISLVVAVVAVPEVSALMASCVGLVVLAGYAYVSFNLIPAAEARRAEAERIAAEHRKVLRLPLPSEMENRRGKYVQDQRGRRSFARVADL